MRITCVGRLIQAKGFQDLISVCNSLDASLVILGDGPYRSSLERMCSNGHVKFVGEATHDQVMRELAASDIFVNPSYSEGLPTTVLEAASVGLPIIATDVGGTREIITHGISGLLYRPGNLGWLSIHLETLMNSPGLRQLLGKRAQEVARSFTWESTIDKWEKVLKEAKG
jgi:glycosyltransferase involved in cell wall biosynthesis